MTSQLPQPIEPLRPAHPTTKPPAKPEGAPVDLEGEFDKAMEAAALRMAKEFWAEQDSQTPPPTAP